MKHTPSLSISLTLSISFLAIVACGGGKKPPPAAPKEPEPEPAAPVAETKPAPEPEPEPAPEPPPPPPPAALHAQAELAPVKGVKIKAVTVTFTQQGTDPVAIGSTGWFDGIKAGKYHLVVHGGDACGAKAGKPMGSDIAFTATKSTDSLTVAPVALSIEGEGAIVGHPLVLHADKKGKPGKALACGMIAAGA
jgi:hypothetical protein